MISKRALKLCKLYCQYLKPVNNAPFFCNYPKLVNQISTSPVRFKRKLTVAQGFKDKTVYSEDEYADTFGHLGNAEVFMEKIRDDPEDIKEYKRLKSARGQSLEYYVNEIKKCLKNNEYKKALKLLEVDMVNDRFSPMPYLYRLFFSYNAEIGDIKEAYRLYVQYKKRGGVVKPEIYTSLFDACANSKNSLLALEKAGKLRESIMNDKNISVNLSHYNVMLKAFGRHADLPTCFNIVDEVLEKKDKVKSETFSFLMQACISDRNAGLRHALMTWRKMLQNRCVPDIYVFNNMLRCIRDCGLGDVELVNNFVEQLKNESDKFFRRKVVFKKKNGKVKREILKIPVPKKAFEDLLEAKVSKKEKTGDHNNAHANENFVPCGSCHSADEICPVEESENSEKTVENQNINGSESNSKPETTKLSTNVTPDLNIKLPNFLALTPDVGSVLSFGSMTRPWQRMMCVGGLKGFLNTMREFGVKPDIKTFTLLLNVVPNNQEAEESIIAEVKSHDVKLDTAFFNVLIKRRSIRNKNCPDRDALKLMQEAKVSPDLITFGVLAIGCGTHESGKDLIKSIRSSGYRVNSEILGGLLERAHDAKDMNYVKTILDAAKEDEVTLSSKFIATLGYVVRKEKLNRMKQLNANGNSAPEEDV